MEWIKKLIAYIKAKNEQRNKAYIEKHAVELYQITEHKKQLWLTFNGVRVAPFSLITTNKTAEESINLVNTLRKMYVDENTKK